jgi:hypothetical protein
MNLEKIFNRKDAKPRRTKLHAISLRLSVLAVSKVPASGYVNLGVGSRNG